MAPIALLTDFGLTDHYVGTMKGVIQGIAPGATVIDVTHGIDQGDIHGAAYQLLASCRYFPEGSIFCVVVDPGVGTSRKGIIAATPRYRFIGPDNGVLTWALQQGEFQAWELAETRFQLPAPSRTFHGRDIFSPAAAWAARGAEPSAFGPPVDPLLLPWSPTREEHGATVGQVLSIDRFGNVITSIKPAAWPLQNGSLSIGPTTIARFCSTFGDLEHGAMGALVGSSGYVEIVRNGASAADLLKCKRGDEVRLS